MVSLWHGYGTDRVCMGYRLHQKKAPHIQGKPLKKIAYRTELGSPPHARGKLDTTRTIFFVSRITPARTGKTVHLTFSGHLWRGHPRTHGENTAVAFRIASRDHPRAHEENTIYCLCSLECKAICCTMG